jgi:AcrR family transcriptional regulator
VAERQSASRRRGRPPRIGVDDIVRAVHEIGVENATMRRVAEHLCVSVPGLYHHVGNHDELLALVARSALAGTRPPRYRGQHWATWLRSYAGYVRTALAAEPALLEKFLSGAVSDDGEMRYIGEALDVLADHGLGPDEAMSVWAAVSAMAIGSVTEAHREHVNAEGGRPWPTRLAAATAHAAPSDLPTLRAIAASGYDPFGVRAFDEHLSLLLAGVTAQYGLAPEPRRRRR